jgi:hypothetical protein
MAEAYESLSVGGKSTLGGGSSESSISVDSENGNTDAGQNNFGSNLDTLIATGNLDLQEGEALLDSIMDDETAHLKRSHEDTTENK